MSLSDSQLSLAEIELIDQVCDRFEAELRSGDFRLDQLDEFLQLVDSELRPHLLAQLVVVHRDLRIERDESPKQEDYLSWFHGNENALDALFADRAKTSHAEFSYQFEPIQRPSEGSSLGDFELLEELGRGGMGIVFKARQRSLDRHVALKVLQNSPFASDEVVQRFRNEAHSVASLQHPNIVQIFGVETVGGWHFFSMELLDGLTLHDRINGRGLPTAEAAGNVAYELARTIQFAHDAGILHRDLKPQNLFVDAQQNLTVVDFGLAKRIDEDDGLTQTGAFLGTPSYVSPEQARDILPDNLLKKYSFTRPTGPFQPNPKIDVYGIGAVLYAMLTGRAPHVGKTERRVYETLEQVAFHAPVNPRAIDPTIPADLETICLKCLRKDPSQRYETAQEVADDIRRWQEKRPILAKRTTFRDWLFKIVARNKFNIAIYVTLISFALISLAASWVAFKNNALSEFLSAKSIVASDKTGRRTDVLSSIKVATRFYNSPELRDLAISAYANVDLVLKDVVEVDNSLPCEFDAKLQVFATTDGDGTIKICRVDDESLLQTLPSIGSTINQMELSPDGRFLAAYYNKLNPMELGSEPFRIWNVKTGKPLDSIPSLIIGSSWAFGSDSRLAVVGSERDGIAFYDLEQDRIEKQVLAYTWMKTLALSPDGRRVAVVRNKPDRVEIVDFETDEPNIALPFDATVMNVDWSPNGRWLAVACGGTVQLQDVESRKTIWKRTEHDPGPYRVKFSPNGRFLVSMDWDGKMCFWRVSDGFKILDADCGLNVQFHESLGRLAGAFAPNGIGIWEIVTGEEVRTLATPNEQWEKFVSFSPCGKLLATSGFSGVRLWSVDDPLESIAEVTHEGVRNICFTEEGIFGSGRSEHYFWPVRLNDDGLKVGQLHHRPYAKPLGFRPKQIAMSSNARWLAALDCDSGAIHVSDLLTDTNQILEDNGALNSIAISPDGSKVVTTPFMQRTFTKVWDWQSGSVIKEFNTKDANVVFTPDGKFLIVGASKKYSLIDASTLEVVREFPRRISLGSPIGCSRESGLMAVTLIRNHVTLVHWESGVTVANLHCGETGRICDVSLSQDGRYLAVALTYGSVKLWNLRNLNEKLAGLGMDWPEFKTAHQEVVTFKAASRFIQSGKRRSDQWHLDLVAEYERNRDWPSLIAHLDELILRYPNNAEYCRRRANAYVGLRDWEMARRDFEMSTGSGDQEILSWFARGALQLKLGDELAYQMTCKLALDLFSETNELKTHSTLTWLCLVGNADLEPAQITELLNKCQNFCEMYPMNRQARSALAIALVRAEKLEKAQLEIKRSMELHSLDGSPSDWLLSAIIYQELGDQDSANASLQKSLDWIETNRDGKGVASPGGLDLLEYEILTREINELAK